MIDTEKLALRRENYFIGWSTKDYADNVRDFIATYDNHGEKYLVLFIDALIGRLDKLERELEISRRSSAVSDAMAVERGKEIERLKSVIDNMPKHFEINVNLPEQKEGGE